MINRDDPVDGLAPVDDPRVTAFRRWLRAADEWCSTRAERNDQEAAYDEAGVLIAGFQNVVLDSPFPYLMHERIVTEWETAVINPEWSERAAKDRRVLLGWARIMHDFGQALGIGNSDARALSADFLMRADGVKSLVGAEIPPTSRRGFNPVIMDFMKSQTIRLAHYNDGLEGSPWLVEHAKIYPGLSEDTRKGWNSLVPASERANCRRVGDLVRRKETLTPEDAKVQSQATRFEAVALRNTISDPPTI
jgi:hypothetical protein